MAFYIRISVIIKQRECRLFLSLDLNHFNYVGKIRYTNFLTFLLFLCDALLNCKCCNPWSFVGNKLGLLIIQECNSCRFFCYTLMYVFMITIVFRANCTVTIFAINSNLLYKKLKKLASLITILYL